MSWSIGIDIGGTFTDLVAINAMDGTRITRKVLTTPDAPLDGVLRACDVLSQSGACDVSKALAVVHATTLATNTLLERKGARAAMITTRGFRDIVETGREDRYDLFDLQIDVQSPLIRRNLRLGVPERIGPRGEVIAALDLVELENAIDGLPAHIEAVAVCFLHSYANAAHEHEAARMLEHLRPKAYVSLSSAVAPIIREYERFIATVINVYVGPRVSEYLSRLEHALAGRGFSGFTGIMKSDGGMCSPSEASRFPVRILESGPAAGVLSAAHTAQQERLAVAFDMGGTTAKACLIEEGRAVIADELEVARLARFAKNSGLPLRIPGIDLVEIGAGGGSIASIGPLGLLQVGPQSAASTPGPACYGHGGADPTVTDADLLLGYLNPAYFAGGSIALDTAAAENAIERQILAKTGTHDLTAAAWGIHDVVNENMAREIRLHCVEHGIDPGSVTLIATGGAGPVHAAHVLAKFGARRLVCPPDVGVASAVGLLLAPRSVERTITRVALLSELGGAGVKHQLESVREELASLNVDLGVAPEASFTLHMRLRGQAYEIRVDAPKRLTEESLVQAFVREHLARFGRAPPQGAIEIVSWSVTLAGPKPVIPASCKRPIKGPPRAARTAYFGPLHGWLLAEVAGRADLDVESNLTGPVLIEDEGSTIVVPPGRRATADEWGNLCVEGA